MDALTTLALRDYGPPTASDTKDRQCRERSKSKQRDQLEKRQRQAVLLARCLLDANKPNGSGCFECGDTAVDAMIVAGEPKALCAQCTPE